MKSGATSRKRFYNEFLDNLNKWCEKFSMIRTLDDMKKEEELRKVLDWSREFWH